MNSEDTMEMEDSTVDPPITKAFTFSPPSVHPLSPKLSNPTQSFNKVFDTAFNQKPTFTFASPMAIEEQNDQGDSGSQAAETERQFKPKISRTLYKPTINVFAQALKETAMTEDLKKNTRLRSVKANVENCITCVSVPKALINKQSAKEYFASFGNILKITIRPKKKIITVAYVTKQEASVAYSDAGEYMGERFDVVWTKTLIEPKSPAKKKDAQKNITAHLKSDDDEVKYELAAMIGQEYNVSENTEVKETVTPKRKKTQQGKGAASKAAQKTEKAATKSEKLKQDSQISYLLPNAPAEELQSIIQQAALTSEDKYKVLEARDRLMRLKQVKSHSLATAKVTSGTCPDMCPEKERLMREAKRQVAVYELESNEYRINHSIAVKQYSRSSADQEEPMPHDLRPVRSLKMTMSYLLHEIVDLCDQPGTNLGEWYHFLWDRTRGIRKDITQQELCCTESVQLVEQCARFHIVCSERLGAEDASVFDKKINSDNLTKCLQSLKYMYHDLRQKGINCRNEPEFRAYIVLLNLNSGSFVWELQRLPESIQKSPKVQFALEVYKALESNNYCKFFKLVEKTTYLNACILLRYFDQVRLKALSVMVKAYCRTTSTAFPLYELIHILGFEDENEAINFCEQLGLNVSRDELHVLLNRQNFSMPILNIKQSRACNLIEYKRVSRNLTMGQCIAGCEMPERTYKYHKPHCSFDSKGFLLSEAINAEDQINNTHTSTMEYEQYKEIQSMPRAPAYPEKEYYKPETLPSSKPSRVFAPVTTTETPTSIATISKPETTFSFAAAASVQPPTSKSEPSQLLKQTTEKQVDTKPSTFLVQTQTSISTNATQANIFSMAHASTKDSTTTPKVFTSSHSKQSTSAFTPATSKSIFSGAIQKNIFAWTSTPSTIFGSTSSVTQTTAQFKSTTSSDGYKPKVVQSIQSLILSTKHDVAAKVAKRAEDRVKEDRKRVQQINKDTKDLLDNLQKEIVDTICSSIVREEIDRLEEYNIYSEQCASEIIDMVAAEFCGGVLKEELANEKKLYEMRMKAKNKVVLKYLNTWKRHAHKRKRQREALDSTPVWVQKYPIGVCAQLLYSKEQDTVIRNMGKPSPESQLKKCHAEPLAPIEVIAYKGMKENMKSLDTDARLHFYCKLVISWPNLREEPILRQYKKIMNKYLNPDDYTANPILKVYRPNQFESLHMCIKHFEGFIHNYDLIGTDAFLFVASASEDMMHVTKRLTKTILSRHETMPTPLIFVALGDGDLDALNKAIVPELEILVETGCLSKYMVMFEKYFNEKTILNLTQSAVLWLSANKLNPQPLEVNYLRDVLHLCLTQELWLRIFNDCPFHMKLWHALKDPIFIVKLHNEAVSHLTDVLLDPKSYMHTQFAPELKSFLNTQHTLPCSYEYFGGALNREEYKAEIEKSMSRLTLPPWKYPWPISDGEELRQCIITYSQEALPNYDSSALYSSLFSNLFLTSGTFSISSFVEILLYIMNVKIRQVDKDLKAIYNPCHVKNFRILPWWFKSNTFAEYQLTNEEFWHLECDKENDSTSELRIKKRKINQINQSVSQDVINWKEFEPLITLCEKKSNVPKVSNKTKELDEKIAKLKEQMSSTEDKLRTALLNNSDPLLEKSDVQQYFQT